MKCFTLMMSLFFLSSLSFAASIAALPTVTGRNLLVPTETIKLETKAAKKSTVLIFMSAQCPCSASHEELIKTLAQDFPEHQFVAVHSNSDEELEASRKHFKDANLNFPVIQDEKSTLANHFGALKTPHSYVLDLNGNIVYQGGVTDSHVGPSAKKQYLREVLTDLQAGKAPRYKEKRSLGCYIQRGENT